MDGLAGRGDALDVGEQLGEAAVGSPNADRRKLNPHKLKCFLIASKIMPFLSETIMILFC